MELRREALVTQKDKLEKELAKKRLDLPTLQLETAVSKTLNERKRAEALEKLNEEIKVISKKIEEVDAEIDKLKRFDRKQCLENIDFLLSKCEIKLGALEKESGNTPGYLSRMRTGKSPSDPSIEFLMTASEVLNVPLAALISTDLTKATAAEEYILKFIKKVFDDTEKENIKWIRETELELDDLSIQHSSKGEPYVNHPLYFVNNDGYARYNSQFIKDYNVKPCGNCYHTTLSPTNQDLYIMKCEKRGNSRRIPNGEEFYELYIVQYHPWPEVGKLCNTLDLSEAVAATLDSLTKSIEVLLNQIRIDDGVKDAIDSYMKGTASDDEEFRFDAEEIPFYPVADDDE